jgi:hypothetical protein
MNNPALEELLRQHAPGERESVALALALVQRVRHLLEDERVIALLDAGQRWSDSQAGTSEQLQAWAEEAAQLARSHPGSRSIDGTAHAAVSASHAVASALRGRVLDAADYAAYAAVYAYSASAVLSPEAFEDEHVWQVSLAARMLKV